MSKSLYDRATEAFKEAGGERKLFMRLMTSGPNAATYNGASACFRLLEEEARQVTRLVQRLNPPRLQVPIPAPTPSTRTMVMVIEVEIGTEEDAFQTAELATQLLTTGMDNTITLQSVGEKVNG